MLDGTKSPVAAAAPGKKLQLMVSYSVGDHNLTQIRLKPDRPINVLELDGVLVLLCEIHEVINLC